MFDDGSVERAHMVTRCDGTIELPIQPLIVLSTCESYKQCVTRIALLSVHITAGSICSYFAFPLLLNLNALEPLRRVFQRLFHRQPLH